MTKREFIQMLVRRGLVTTDPAKAEKCCGLPRDEDGFCVLRWHPIYYKMENPREGVPSTGDSPKLLDTVGDA